MREYTTKDKTKIRKIGRYKKIFFNNNGDPYFKWNGNRIYFDNSVLRLSYPIMYETENRYLGVIGGYITISNTISVLVEIDDVSEYVQLWEEVE